MQGTCPIIDLALAEHMLFWFQEGLHGGGVSAMADGSIAKGQVCVEAVICHVLDGEVGDHPRCVDKRLTEVMIAMNDALVWKDNKDRGDGLSLLGLAQLGTDGWEAKDKQKFSQLRESMWEHYHKPKVQQAFLDDTLTHNPRVNGVLHEIQNGASVDGFLSHDNLAHSNPQLSRDYADMILAILDHMKTPGMKWVKELCRDRLMEIRRKYPIVQ